MLTFLLDSTGNSVVQTFQQIYKLNFFGKSAIIVTIFNKTFEVNYSKLFTKGNSSLNVNKLPYFSYIGKRLLNNFMISQ